MSYGAVSKIWEAIGLIGKEFRFLVFLIIIHTVTFFSILHKIDQKDILWLFITSALFISIYFFGFLWLYNRQAILPYLIGFDVDGKWTYEIDAAIDGTTFKASGECNIMRKFSSLYIDGIRTRIYENWEICQKEKNCIEIGKPECDICDKCKKVNQPWSTTWGAVTKDMKLRFDYYFQIGQQVNTRGYCVLELRDNDPDNMHGFLMYLPPHGAPGKIVFKRTPKDSDLTQRQRKILPA